MEEAKGFTKNKGGRPEKVVKRDKLLGVKCTTVEAFLIKAKAEKVQLTVSEYLREQGLTGKIDMHRKVFPKEVLQAIASLGHLAANLNQIAKKRNSSDELNALERAELQYAVLQFRQFIKDCKQYFQ